jgi:hypothetical protein
VDFGAFRFLEASPCDEREGKAVFFGVETVTIMSAQHVACEGTRTGAIDGLKRLAAVPLTLPATWWRDRQVQAAHASARVE